jgi:hypothetical protein
MSFTRHAGVLARGAALWAGFAIVTLCLVLGALGFFAAALFVWVAAHLGTAAAAALTALGLLLLALGSALTGRRVLRRLRASAPSLFGGALGTLSMATSLVGLLVRQDPKRAILLALLAGALTEYFTAED